MLPASAWEESFSVPGERMLRRCPRTSPGIANSIVRYSTLFAVRHSPTNALVTGISLRRPVVPDVVA